MRLPDANIDATIAGVVYRVELNLWRGGDHDEDLHDTSFFVSFFPSLTPLSYCFILSFILFNIS